MSGIVDVIVPVYKGLEATRRCIESVLACSARTRIEVVTVDDSSPEPEISRYLEGLAAAGRITVLRNHTNAGFVASVNRGMALHEDRDVILLNSDTEVANDWVDRLGAAAQGERVATVTPFSNNATICSYPYEGWKEGLPGALGLPGLDRLFADANRGHTLELPTAVGFCMYVPRDALRRFGSFDEERFGRGYGEENDFSRRAAKAGWRNLLACDVFVFHEGSVSFSGERSQRVRAATQALLEVHPEYTRLVYDFIAADPAEGARRAVDLARIAVSAEEAAHVLAERADERRALRGRLGEAERFAADRGSHALEVHQALAELKDLVAQRDRELAAVVTSSSAREAEIAALQAALAEAQAAAAAHWRDLERIRSHWVFRLYVALKGSVTRRGPESTADQPSK